MKEILVHGIPGSPFGLGARGGHGPRRLKNLRAR